MDKYKEMQVAKKKLSSVDTAWLRMEEPNNLMMPTGVMVFGAPIEYERLRATLEHGLLPFDRFRQRVRWPWRPGGRPYWEDDPELDLDYHIQRAVLPPPADQAALQEVTSLLASTQLDLSRPLWQIHLVEGYGDGCALVCRLHHSIGDGLALIHVVLSLTDTEADAPWPETPYAVPSKPRPKARWRPCRPRHLAKATLRVTGRLVREGTGIIAHPSRVGDLVHTGAGGATAFGRLVLRWPDAKTILKGPLGVPKRTAWSLPIPLQEVKDIGRGLGGTVNDILLTAVTGALRRYLRGRGQEVGELEFRAVVPVNLRRPGTEDELGNKFGLVFLSLPVGITDPVQRLRELKRRMDGLKGSLEAPVAYGILTGIGMSPEWVQDIVVDMFGAKGTAVVTNVVGPRERIYLAGAPLESFMFWVPQAGRLGLGVSILSYAGQVWVGVITDEGLVPDPDLIITALQTELDQLRDRATKGEEVPSLSEVAAKLDEALATVDALLEARGGEPTR